jgi:hypothetical protein
MSSTGRKKQFRRRGKKQIWKDRTLSNLISMD